MQLAMERPSDLKFTKAMPEECEKWLTEVMMWTGISLCAFGYHGFLVVAVACFSAFCGVCSSHITPPSLVFIPI